MMFLELLLMKIGLVVVVVEDEGEWKEEGV